MLVKGPLTGNNANYNVRHDIDGLVQDCCNSSALALELLQSYTKPWIFIIFFKSGDLWPIISFSKICHQKY